MKRRDLLVVLAGSTMIVASILTACNRQSPEDAEVSTPARTLIMATSADYPPFEFFESERGQGDPIGFDIDIARYITEQLGYELEIVDMDFNWIIPALQADHADFAMAGMTQTEERLKAVTFSDVYYESKIAIVTQQGQELKDFPSLVGKVVGVQQGTIEQEKVEEAAKENQGITIETRNNVANLIQEIKSGGFDAAVVESTVAREYVKDNPELSFSVIESEEENGLAIAFPKNSDLTEEFNQVLQQMKENGRVDQLAQKWFEDYYAREQ